MRVFVTGATGFVGSAVVQALLAAGHQVLGLARSEAAAQAVSDAGAEPHLGSLEDPDSLIRGAAQADGVIHTAFNHDFSKFADNCEAERSAIQALGEALAGSGRRLVVTSGVALMGGAGQVVTEATEAPNDPSFPRTPEAALELISQGVQVMAMRLPPSVHGQGDHGFVPRLIDIAREKGCAAYVGDGENRWPATHRLDVAQMYRLALEAGESGMRYHAIAEQGVPFRQIAEVIGKRLGLPMVSKTPEEAAEHFGWFARFAAIDCPSSSDRSRTLLGWSAAQPGLIADLDQPYYFGG